MKPSIQACWQVTASNGTQHDQRTVWAADGATALIAAREARGWGATWCCAKRITFWRPIRDVPIATRSAR